MKEKLTLKNLSNCLPILGLAFLLLLSPCKVKNFIHAELGIPKAEVSNIGKTPISSSNCSTIELTENALTFSKQAAQQSLAFHPNEEATFYFKAIDFSNPLIIPNQKRNVPVSLTPYYILYQNFKVYLS